MDANVLNKLPKSWSIDYN